MKRWLKRITLAVVVLELFYLALGNLALRLPLTQTVLNTIRPDKFEVSWDEAWTWYPFRVHARGVSANGQSRRQQWQLELPQGSASIALLPLIFKRVNLSGIQGENVVYFQRPRLQADNDYAETRAAFPPIRNRELNHAEPMPTGKRGWTINVASASVSGTHTLWIKEVRGTLTGELQTGFRYRTRGGPFSLRNSRANVHVDSVTINGDRETLRNVSFNGRVEFAEFVPRQTRGMDALAYLTLHAEVSGEVDSLAFLNLYLQHVDAMEIQGEGAVAGQLHFERGTLLPVTHIDISAPRLSLALLDHHAEGSGAVVLDVTDETADTLAGSVRFNELVAKRTGDERLLFTGEGLVVDVRMDTDLFPQGGGRPRARYFAAAVPEVTVPDLAAYQHYIPDKLRLHFYGGEGTLRGSTVVDDSIFRADFKLDADDTDVGIKDYRFRADVDIALLSDSPDENVAGVDVSGSHIRLSDARLANSGKGVSDAWQGWLTVDEGRLNFNLREAAGEKGLLWAITDESAKSLLDAADGDLVLTGEVSNLDWLNQLIKNDYQAEITGRGELQAKLLLQSGWPAAGTRVEVLPDNLAVKVLDYIAEGEGSVTLNVEEGGEQPDARLEVMLQDARFRRLDEDRAFIEHVQLQLIALAKDLTFEGPAGELALRLRIPAAKVTDMSVYNQFLPGNSPLQLLGGEADLVADIELQPETARGYVRLKSSQLRSRLDEQEISGDVTANINIAGGTPRDMAFDISGSQLLLDNIRVTGKQETLAGSDWNARVDFTRANTVWKKPLRLKVEADIEMKDSTPIVAMLSNQRGKYGWIEKMISVGRIEGKASVDIQQQQIVFPHAFAGSDRIDVGAKGIITEQSRDGVIFARFRKLKGLLKIRDGKRNFDVIQAQKKFDEYSPGALIK